MPIAFVAYDIYFCVEGQEVEPYGDVVYVGGIGLMLVAVIVVLLRKKHSTNNVLLQWSDAGLTSRRPSTVGITLYRNGSVYENYTLSASDNWRHTWPGLDQAYSWSVVQTTALDTYSVSYQSSGNVLVITDVIRAAQSTGTSTSTNNGSIPTTGLLWWPVDVLALLGVVLFTLGWRKRFGGKEKKDAA